MNKTSESSPIGKLLMLEEENTGLGWKARYVKDVDVNEVTMRFYQEIYDDNEKLVELHHKYPIDQGHQKVEE